jgi:hypothetical protein
VDQPGNVSHAGVSWADCCTASSGAVWVPALVESKSGKIAYGLSVSDFSIKDNGVEQQIVLQSDLGAQPISLLFVIQTGHNSADELAKISRLPDLIDSILTSPQDQIAIVTFDSSPHLLQAFTANSDAISTPFASISPENSASSLLDAMQMAISSFRKAAPGNQKVIVLISAGHDHGSVGSDAGSLLRGVSSSNVSVYSLSFRPGKTEIFGKLRSLNPLAMTGSAMQGMHPKHWRSLQVETFSATTANEISKIALATSPAIFTIGTTSPFNPAILGLVFILYRSKSDIRR